jgi:hypothetical protein
MPGYSRECIGQTPFAWSLDDAMEGLGPRADRATAFWRWRVSEGAWAGFQKAALGHLLGRLGPGARYWDVSGGRQPSAGVSERPPTRSRPFTVLSTLAMIFYPSIAAWLGLDAHDTGVFLGGTIHDVAQVVGAGYGISGEVGNYAVLTKMLRVAMLLPVVMALSVAVRHRLRVESNQRTGPLLPPFLVAFVALIVAGSLGLVPASVATLLNEVARACLVIAIAAVGLKASPLEMKVGGSASGAPRHQALFVAALVIVVQKVAS